MSGRVISRFVALAVIACGPVVSGVGTVDARVASGETVAVNDDRQTRSFDIAHDPVRDRYLAVWRDFDGFAEGGVIGVLLGADGGTLTDPFVVAPQESEPTALVPSSLASPHVEYNPVTDQYVVVVARNGADPATPAADRRRSAVFGRLVSAEGELVGAEVALNPPLGEPGQQVCTPRYPDVTVDVLTGGYTLVYARTYETADDLGDVCEDLEPSASVTVIQRLDGRLGQGPRQDFPSVNSSGPFEPRVAYNTVTSTTMVTQPYEGATEVGPSNRNGLRFAAQIFGPSFSPIGPVLQIDVDPIEPTGTGPVNDARPVADPATGNWFILSSARFFGPAWTNLLDPTGAVLRPGTRLDDGRPTSVAAVGDGTFVFTTEDGTIVHVRSDGTRIHPAPAFPPSIVGNSAIALGPQPGVGLPTPGVAIGIGPDGVASVAVDVVAPGALPLTPARLLDTRNGAEFTTIDGRFAGGGRAVARSTVTLDVGGRGGVPTDADAVLINVAAAGAADNGFVTTYPCDAAVRPTTANLNYSAANASSAGTISRVSETGTICLYVSEATDLVVDVNGYVPAGGSVESLVPARLLDTRPTTGAVTIDGQGQGIGRVRGGSTTTVEVAGRGGVADDADAVLVNVAAIRPGGQSYFTVFPCDEPRPLAANLNAAVNHVVNNLVLAKVSEVGTICVFSSASTDITVDVSAFIPSPGGMLPLVPARLLDTRVGTEHTTIDGEQQGIGAVSANDVTTVQVAGRGGVGDDATGAVLNLAAINPTTGGYMTVYPCDAAQRPLAANLNFPPSSVVSNAVFVKLGASGTVCIYSTARADLAVDVVGSVVDS